MIRSNTTTAAVFICAAIGLATQAHASPPIHPASHPHRPHSPHAATPVLASVRASTELRYADLGTPHDPSGAIAEGRRWRGLTWTLLQTPREDWTEGQRITVLVGAGPSAQRYRWLRGAPPLSDTAAQTVAPGTASAGWTKPLGLRLAIRW